eukprot:3554877-Amphidinium_carterae.1
MLCVTDFTQRSSPALRFAAGVGCHEEHEGTDSMTCSLLLKPGFGTIFISLTNVTAEQQSWPDS